MRKPSLWVLVLGAGVLLGLAGCGGGTPPPSNGGGTPPSPSSITLTVVDGQGLGYAAAYQVGSGPWTKFNPSSTHTYTFNLTGSNKYGVAVRCGTNNPTVHVIQATNAELDKPKIICSLPSPSTVSYTLTVDVTAVPGIAGGDEVWVSGQNFLSRGSVTQSGSNYTASVNLTAPAGIQDLVVAVVDLSNPNLYNIKAAKVLRKVNITNGGSSSYTFTSGDVLPQGNVSVNLPSGFTAFIAVVNYLSADNKGGGVSG